MRRRTRTPERPLDPLNPRDLVRILERHSRPGSRAFEEARIDEVLTKIRALLRNAVERGLAWTVEGEAAIDETRTDAEALQDMVLFVRIRHRERA